MSRLPNLIVVLFAVTSLSACATSGIITDNSWPKDRRTIEGFELAESDRVLFHGITQVEAKALSLPSIGRFTLTGLSGLADVDPLFSIVDVDGRIQTYVGGTLTSDLAKPVENTARPWLDLFHGSLVGARRKSEPLREADLEQIYASFFDSALTALDPYSRYAGRLQARSNRETRNGFGGIGLRYLLHDLGLEVLGLQSGAPADAAGLQIGDIITHIDGTSLSAERSWTVRRLLRGPIGSTTTFSVIRGRFQPSISVPIVRRLIVPQTVELAVMDQVAVIAINSFNQQTSQTVEALLAGALARTPQISGVILDLRGDPGGLLDQAVTVSDLFMNRGPIVSTRGRHPESIQRYQAFDGDISGGRPIAVLVDSRSASASEIVAAAIQDSGRGLIVGTSSYGKGTVQTVIRLPNDGEITLTWSRFHAPSGYAIEDLGVLPIVCTSGVTGSIPAALDNWKETGSRFIAAKAEWRTVASEDIDARAELRSECPAEIRPETSIDLNLAKALILKDILYAQAIGLTATTSARSKPR